MLWLKLTGFMWILFIFWSLVALGAETREEDDTCSDWKLSGGRIQYEGFVEVKYKGRYVNLCADTLLNDANEVCKKLKLSTTAGVNISNASQQEEAISFTNKCGENETVRKTCVEENTDCCHPAWICCITDVSKPETCSANWTETFVKECHYSDGKRFTYSQIRAKVFSKKNNNPTSWTKSALVKHRPKGMSNLIRNCSIAKDILKQCSNDCLNNGTVKKRKCGCQADPSQNGTECYSELQIIDDIREAKERLELCIAAEMSSGIITFTAEDCDKLLQPLCLKDLTTTTTFSTTTLLMKPDEASEKSIPIVTCIVLGVILGFVAVSCLVYKCSRRTNNKDSLRTNSMCNRTYDRQMPKNDEEYAIISEIELDSGTTLYKPRLPDRGNSSSGNTYHTIYHGRDISAPAIITLDEYSTPSDMIKDKVDPADDYTTTYDDPIRHNLKNIDECKRKSETKGTRETNSSESDNIHEKGSRSSHNGENRTSQSYEGIFDNKKETSVNEKVLNIVEKQGKEKDAADCKESKGKDIPGCGFSSSVQSTVKTAGVNLECFTPPVLEGQSSVANNNDYEDTNIIDGNFPSRPKGLFEEHVCLHCLKPEHLKRLGIKIISDKTLDGVDRRLSGPPYKNYYNSSETDKALRRCFTDGSHKDRQKDLIDFEGNPGPDETLRECVVCNNVYDRMGRIKEKLDTKSGGNEYDHLSNWKNLSAEKGLTEKH